ncbi:serine/threonine-protein phosphatase 7 long form [Cinnamomum micranthum f. kanehirae]|uniref:Serine/threonine-protein phosphatase 7 long form n=1 Tax=Cinnamomum micranthum f. kanehirae TaxID=337451 RepID=A0A3S3LXU3_9MAGN|nr:serine/threonine-protein phosphatase 7 long form [Cinnamomum micranthum f. kanehirae]
MTGSYRYINKILVSSFVERWQPETNTFHMPYSEMTISLDDVGTILGIPMTVTPQEAHEELSQVWGSSVRLEWFRELFGEVSDADSDEHIQNTARAYLLYILGCTLFTDKSGTRVPVIYLNVLMNFDEVRLYAWGVAALAYLYRQLGMATHKCVKQIAGISNAIRGLDI